MKSKNEKLPEKQGKSSSNRQYSKPIRPKRSRIIRVESTSPDSSRVSSDEEGNNNSSNNNQLPVSYLKSSCGPSRVDKTPKSQDEQNITSSYFINEQKNKSSHYDKVQFLPNDTNSPGSSRKRCSQFRKRKKVTSSYFADKQASSDKCKKIEQKDS